MGLKITPSQLQDNQGFITRGKKFVLLTCVYQRSGVSCLRPNNCGYWLCQIKAELLLISTSGGTSVNRGRNCILSFFQMQRSIIPHFLTWRTAWLHRYWWMPIICREVSTYVTTDQWKVFWMFELWKKQTNANIHTFLRWFTKWCVNELHRSR